MSQIENIALKMKLDKSSMERIKEYMSEPDVDTIRFDKNPYRDPINTDRLTLEQSQVLDKILYESRERYSGTGAYNHAYDNNYELDVDFIDKGKMVVRVMDKHNFYEAELMPSEYLTDSSVGLLTKLWINISKAVKE